MQRIRYTSYSFLFLASCLLLNAPLCFAEVVPNDVSQLIIEPKTETVLQFQASVQSDKEVPFAIYDTDGNLTTIHGVLKKNGELFETPITLEQGYWEIAFENQELRFGILSIPKLKENSRDEYFAIDGALSWLVREDKLREEIIRSAKRVGITMVRERFRLSGVALEKDRFDWETSNRYEKLRKYYKEQGIEIQELFHNAPDWMGKVKVYPKDLLAFGDASTEIAKRWENTWGAIEMWNEPDISFGGHLPADQYVAVLRAFTYKIRESGVKTPIIGGVVAHFNDEWLATAKANNMLDLIDIFSFHTYDRALSMENIVAKFRNYLNDEKGNGNMPLWLTECGRPWKKGPQKPPKDQDFESACDITMKGVEAKCCGVAKYFPFVLPYYEENDNNFGMLDKSGTPLRSFAAYAQQIRKLSHCEYIGDLRNEYLQYENGLENAKNGVKRARIFQKEDANNGQKLLILYTDQKTPLKVKPKFAVKNIERLTGEPGILDENGFLNISDGLVYLLVENLPEEMIDRNTTAMRLYSHVNKKYDSNLFDMYNSPVIGVYEYNEKTVTPNATGYKLGKEAGDSISVTLRVYNLSEKTQSVVIDDRLTGIPRDNFEMPKKSTKIITQNEKIDSTSEREHFHFDVIASEIENEQESQQRRRQCLQMVFYGNPTLESFLKEYPKAVAIPIGKERWQTSITGNAKLTIENQNDNKSGVVFHANFHGGDRWCYPRLRLPEDFRFSEKGAFFGQMRAKVPSEKDFIPRMFLFENKTGSGYLSSDNTILAGKSGQNIAFRIPVTSFHYNASTPLDDNGRLDTNEVKQVSLGFNTQADEVILELDALYYCE